MTAADKAAQRKEDIGMALLSAAAAGLQSGSPTLLGALGAAGAGAAPVIREASKEKRAQEREDRRFEFEQLMTERGINREDRANALRIFTDSNEAEQRRILDRERMVQDQKNADRIAELQERQIGQLTGEERLLAQYLGETPEGQAAIAAAVKALNPNPDRADFTPANVNAAAEDVARAEQNLGIAKNGKDPAKIAAAQAALAEAIRLYDIAKAGSAYGGPDDAIVDAASFFPSGGQ
jgi:hypothetical protein